MKMNMNKANKYSSGGGSNLKKTPNKKMIVAVVLLVVLIGVITKVTYSAFDYTFNGEANKITTDQISLKLLESNKDIISIKEALPMADEEGMMQTETGNVFNIAVETKTHQNTNIGYKLNIEKLEPDEGYTSISDEEIKIYLTDMDDNKILGPVKISELDNYNLYEDVNIHNNIDNTQVDKYKIRVWIDKYVDASSWDENTKLEYKFKIGVNSLENQGKYTVTYSPNGGEGKMATSVYDENTQENLRKNIFTRGGYTFKGWSTASDGNIEYNDQTKATTLTTDQNNKNKTLYAVWQPNTYTVTYNPNGGTLPLGFTSTTTDYKWEETDGVYKSGNYNISNSTSTIKSNEFTLTETQTISFDWAVSSESASYDYLYYTIYKDGTALSGTGASTKIGGYTSSDTEDNLTYTRIAKTLEPGTYIMEFSYRKDGSGNNGLDRGYIKNITIPGYVNNKKMEDSSFTVGKNNTLKQNQYTKIGYTFKGWSTKENSTNIEYQNNSNLTNIETKITDKENINLYAIWNINKYTVNVVVQNGTVENPSKQVEYNKDTTFNLTTAKEDTLGSVTCTNNQKGTIENNILTVSNITSDTTCTVTFETISTVLYNDGTLMINESFKNRNDNITKHGSVTKEYEAFSNSNSYVLDSSESQLWYNEKNNILSVEIDQVIQPTSTAYWFAELTEMLIADLSNLNTSQVINMQFMFYNAVTNGGDFEVDGLSNWDTSKVTNMNSMFFGLGFNSYGWNIGDISKWNTSKVTNMSYMFADTCKYISSYNLDLSSWDTSSVTNMSYMFSGAGNYSKSWSVGDLSSWDTSNVTDMTSMFYAAGRNAKTFNLNLHSWNTSKVTRMSGMFNSAGQNATTFNLNLSNWDTSSVTDMSYMFSNAGFSATTWSVTIPKTTGSLTNTTSKWYGSSDSVYAGPPTGKSFTLAS